MSKVYCEVRRRCTPELKEEVQNILSAQGLDISDAIHLMLLHTVANGKLPFPIDLPKPKVPNETTIKAIEESREMFVNPWRTK